MFRLANTLQAEDSWSLFVPTGEQAAAQNLLISCRACETFVMRIVASVSCHTKD